MKSPNTLYRNSLVLFVFFLGMAIWGFWPSYFSKLFSQMEIRLHLHGISMTLWCLMLITQSFLVFTKRNDLHKWIGKTSYALVPFIIITATNLLHFKLQGKVLGNTGYYFIALVINSLIAFLIIYGLAIKNKKFPKIHGRYMLCTIFPMVTPITDRLIYHHFKPLIQFAPLIDGRSPIVPFLGFTLVDFLLVGLIIWDWKKYGNARVFLTVLVILLTYHFSVLYFYQFGFWKDFSNWFVSLPLS